ncbi:hypothetical protein [Methylobacterium oryzihabitans]|uniref:Uncharacterized protein n=1 Tax=Methylobacterium oryzihabitans TaxID=2499852 RepID=A0A3S2XNI6_9HYPH|nr:hypothetical protein [Methylobacterium oryzihabitans]RVU19127.1 hypothetical protein EOE48_09570 [Methylobacterium oryzihabitans]
MTVHQRPFAPADAVRLDLSRPAVPPSAVKLTAADDPSRLGAHLDGASPEVRQAAVERSRRVPEPGEVREAWHTLPATIRDRIGEEALLHAFFVIAADTEGRELVLDAADRCEDVASAALTQSMVLAEEALPDLFGTAEAEAPWARGGGAGLVAVQPTAPEVVLGPDGLPGLDAIATAWDRLTPAAQREIGVQAAALAFYGWVAGDDDHAPADRWFTEEAVSRGVRGEDRARPRLDEAAERLLPELFGASGEKPAWAETTTTAPATVTTGPEV